MQNAGVTLVVLAVAGVSVVATDVGYATPADGNTSAATDMPTSAVDECQACNFYVATFDIGQSWEAAWIRYENEDGICHEAYAYCMRCEQESNLAALTFPVCEFSSGLRDDFTSEQDAYNWLIQEIPGCPDDCWESEDALQHQLTDYVESGAVNAIVAMIRDAGTGVVFNEERGALQALGCQGQIVLHIPLSEGLAMAVAGRVTNDGP